MANPKKYVPSYLFSGFQASNPKTPLPAPRLDDELANISQSVGGLVDGLGQIRRSDGKLANAVVDLASLSDEVIRELGGAGAGSGGDGVIFATQAQAEAGTSTAVVMSPLRVRQAIATFAGDGGGGTTPGGPIAIDDVTGLSDALAGKQAVLGFTPENRSNRGQAGGYASLGSDGKVPASQLPASGGGGSGSDPIDAARVRWEIAPSVFVPLLSRLGQEIVLTDGYVEGSGLTDFSDLIDLNLNRAINTRRPFVIPGGKFAASRSFQRSGAPFSIFGHGMTMSAIEWTAGATSSGFDLSFNDDDDFAHFEDFGLYTKLFNAGTALRASFADKIIDNNGNPVVVSRFQPCGRARGLLIRGTDGTLSNGFQRGIVADAPLGFNIQECHAWGASTGADPNYASEEAFYVGKADGYGHPVECLVQNNRAFRWKKALTFEGMEGAFAQSNNFVGVGIGIHFKDTLGRPQLNAKDNHCNAAQVGILLDNCAQFNIEGNLIYLVTRAATTGTGVLVRGEGSRWGSIVNNDFENTDTANNASHLNAIIVERGRDITIDLNRYRRNCPATISGVWLTSGAERVKVGDGEVYEQANGPFGGVSFEQKDDGQGNFVPGMGARYGQNTAQSLVANGPTTLAWQTVSDVRGNMPANLPNGDWTVPEAGVYDFSAGCAMTAAGPSGCFINITRNGTTGNEAIAAGSAYAGSGDTPSPHVATGPIPCAKGDVIRVVANPGADRNTRTVRGTYFNIRRLG